MLRLPRRFEGGERAMKSRKPPTQWKFRHEDSALIRTPKGAMIVSIKNNKVVIRGESGAPLDFRFNANDEVIVCLSGEGA